MTKGECSNNTKDVFSNSCNCNFCKSTREFLSAWDEYCDRQKEKNKTVLSKFYKKMEFKTTPTGT